MPGPVDGFTKAESDARYLPKSTVQVFRVAAGWRAISTGVTASQKTGRTELSRGTSGSMSAVLPLSVPVSLDGKRVRPTAARVCFRQNANTSIGSVGVTIGSGDDPADDVEGQSVAVADQSGCLTIDLKAILVHRNIAPDTALDLHAVASSTGAGFIQLGPADVTLTPDP